jgi:ABC-type transport system substrate-binding protein
LINHRLKAEAEALLRRAQELEKSRPKEAQDLLQRAAELWPRLPELRDRRLRLNREYAVLRVGVRELPRHLWPHLAFTDPERQAVELLFEGLVRIGPDPAAGRAYLPGLAEARPRLIPLGRQFQLAQRVAWSNGEPITADDVVHTVNLLKDPKWSGYSPAWAELIDAAQVGDEPGTVSLTLKQGFLDPLALMTFKILPRQPFHDAARPGAADLRSLDDHRLETAPPVGSGPFVYSGRRTAGSGLPDADVFVANPWWRQDEIQGLAAATAGKARAAQIREVHLVRSDDPARAFASGSLDLALDLRADQVRGLLELVLPPPPGAGPRAEGRKLVVPPPLPNRRIYFLAVNHRDAALRDREGVPPDRDPGRLLRRALAHAIERGKILDRCCRVEPGEKAHRPLNGPYPPSSWACAADLPSLDQPELARTLIQAAVKAGLSKKSFTLKYANDDSHAEQVLAELKRQVEQTLAEADIALELRPLPPHTLRKQVEQTHDYELAYYHYDYPSETYWLWPLFHPRGTGSGRSNYLGYANDSELASLFSKAMSRRDFTEVCRLTQLIHRVFHDKLPFIPLWQLDTRIAFHPDLKMGTIDPLLVFPTIEQWRLDRQ